MNQKKTDRYIFVADSHIVGGEPEKNFFQMLKVLESMPPSTGIVFLGDVFELWIALRSYEGEIHDRFCKWCQNQKQIREIIFCAGNHEFYATVLRRKFFSLITRKDICRDDLLFTHGDRVDRKDISYLLLRCFLRSPLTQLLLFLTGKAFGPPLTQKVLISLKDNPLHKKVFPYNQIYNMMDRAAKKGIRHIAIGHYHDNRIFERNGVHLYALPAFKNAGEIGILDENKQYTCGNWRTLLPADNQEVNNL